MNRRLPVTIIGGFLGAGKTSLLHHIISEHQGGYLAVLVENPGPLNLDAKAIRGLCGAMRRTNDAVFEIPNGDADAQIIAIANCLRDLSLAGHYERVLIELAGTSSPAWLARNFDAFSEFAELQQTICVVDALDYLGSAKKPKTGASLLDFQSDLIAGATLVVLNKCDLLDERQLTDCRGLLRRRHPRIRVVETAYGEVPAEIWSGAAEPPKVEREELFRKVKAALLEAARCSFGPARDMNVDLDLATGKITAIVWQVVVNEVAKKYDEISLDRARLIKPDAVLGETIEVNINTKDFGRIAARTFKEAMKGELSRTEKALSEDQAKDDQRSSAQTDMASALYRTHRPFHPQRFWDWFNADQPGLLRVKGLIWLATRNLLVGGVSRTRWQNGCGAAGIWWAALPREEWPQEPEALMRMQETWREPYGDRRQELVLIGEAGPISTTMRRELDACLLTDAEFALPVKEWASFPDPFPAWDVDQEG